ncbi:MAG: amidohydrolase family protein, partial [Microcoleaceae cyanobacterium]
MNFLQRFFRQFILGVVIVIAIALFTKIAVAQVQATSSILFENVQIFNGTADKLSTASNVLVVDNKIKTIAQVPITSGLTANTTKINGNGRVLMPGLIDNHVHIIMTASTLSDLLNINTTEAELQARAKKEAEEMLLRGFTTVRDLGGPVFQLKANIDQGKTPGPRIYPGGAMISQTSGHADFRTLAERPRRFGGKLSRAEEMGAATIADGRDEILTATRENLRFGATQIKLMAGGGVSSIYDPIDVAQYTLYELKAAVEAADDWGTYVAVH